MLSLNVYNTYKDALIIVNRYSHFVTPRFTSEAHTTMHIWSVYRLVLAPD